MTPVYLLVDGHFTRYLLQTSCEQDDIMILQNKMTDNVAMKISNRVLLALHILILNKFRGVFLEPEKINVTQNLDDCRYT